MTPDEAIFEIKKSKAEGASFSAETQKKFADKWGVDAYKKAFLPAGSEAAAVDYTPARSALAGAGQGLSLGFMDEIGGAAQAVGAGARGLADVVTGPTKLRDLPGQVAEAYRGGRDTMRDYAKTAELINPRAYKAGEIGGAILPIAATAGGAAVGQAAARGLAAAPAAVEAAVPVVRAAVPAVKESIAALGKRLASSAGTNAVIGGAQGAGYSEAGTPEGVAGDAARGFGLGAAFGGAVPAAGALVRGGMAAAKAAGAAGVGQLLGGVSLSAIKKRLGIGGEAIDAASELAPLTEKLGAATEYQHALEKMHSGDAQKILKDSGVIIPTEQVTGPLYAVLQRLSDVPAVTPKFKAGIKRIEDYIANLELSAAGKGGVAADKMYKVNQQIGDAIEWIPAKAKTVIDSQINQAQQEAYMANRELLRRVGGEAYQTLTDTIANDMKKLQFLRDTLGTKATSIERALARSEGKRGTEIKKALEIADNLLVNGELPWSEQVARSVAKEAFQSGAEKTGLSGMIGGGIGGGIIGGGAGALASAAGIPPEYAVPIGMVGMGVGGALRAYHGPRLAAGAIDAISAAQRNPAVRGAAALAGGGSEVAGQVLPSAIRTGMISPEQQNRAPQALTPSELQKARDRLRMQR